MFLLPRKKKARIPREKPTNTPQSIENHWFSHQYFVKWLYVFSAECIVVEICLFICHSSSSSSSSSWLSLKMSDCRMKFNWYLADWLILCAVHMKSVVYSCVISMRSGKTISSQNQCMPKIKKWIELTKLHFWWYNKNKKKEDEENKSLYFVYDCCF